MKFIKRMLLAAAAFGCAAGASAIGWPANYEGVMLQGFYWDSYTDTKWTVLESQADELSQSFKLIWVPNSARAASNPGMGYDPVYWFTNHNTSFGTEAQLRQMIKTFKEKGTGIIEDVVINHRSGATNWTDFPAETWDGQTWKIGTDGICSTDEVKDASGQAKPTGAPDTGEDFNGSRDLDHTNVNVQNNCKAYCRFLLEDMGYAGFRYDMVKGYAPKYTKMYNEATNVEFSVGEYWDGSYDAVKDWIEGTGKTSAAFDFPCKYQINKAWSNNDMTELVWKANGTTDQPAGMIHFGYSQYAVTFVDNHDTYRDGSKFTGNVVAANAFILCSPGTPCVFYPHWKAHKAEIKKLIAVRNAAGVHNNSAVRVLRSSRDCYMAEVTGTKGKLVVKIGSAQVSPDGYSNSDIKASGNDYCVWSKVNVGGGGDEPDPQPTPDTPAKFYVLGEVNGNSWDPAAGVAMKKSGDKFTATVEVNGFFSFASELGTAGDWNGFNAMGVRYGSTSDATLTKDTPAPIAKLGNPKAYTIDPGTYTLTVDFAKMTVTATTGGDEPGPQPGTTDLYVIGNINGANWDVTAPVKMSYADGVYSADVTIDDGGADEPLGFGFFSFVTTTGPDWDTVNLSDRYGSEAGLVAEPDPDYTALEPGKDGVIVAYPANVSAMGATSWRVPVGKYNITADLKAMKVRATPKTSGIGSIAADEEAAPVYYTLQGVRVDAPVTGLYIVVRGSSVSKEYVK